MSTATDFKAPAATTAAPSSSAAGKSLTGYDFGTLTEAGGVKRLDEWLDHLAVCFPHTTREYFRLKVVLDPYADLSSIFVATVAAPADGSAGAANPLSGAIVATVRVFWRTLLVAGQALVNGALGEVSTTPAHQGKGLANALLHRAIAAIGAKGCAVSSLHTGKAAPVYRKLGWAEAPILSVHFPCQRVPPTDSAGTGAGAIAAFVVEPLTSPAAPAHTPLFGEWLSAAGLPTDSACSRWDTSAVTDSAEWQSVMALHASYAAAAGGGLVGAFARDERQWRYWIAPAAIDSSGRRRLQRFVARRRAGGPVVAYMFVSSNPVKYAHGGRETLSADEFGCDADELKVDGGAGVFAHLIARAAHEHLSHSAQATAQANAKGGGRGGASPPAPAPPRGHVPLTPAPDLQVTRCSSSVWVRCPAAVIAAFAAGASARATIAVTSGTTMAVDLPTLPAKPEVGTAGITSDEGTMYRMGKGVVGGGLPDALKCVTIRNHLFWPPDSY